MSYFNIVVLKCDFKGCTKTTSVKTIYVTNARRVSNIRLNWNTLKVDNAIKDFCPEHTLVMRGRIKNANNRTVLS